MPKKINHVVRLIKKINKNKSLYLSARVFSTVVLIVYTVNKQTNITNRTEILLKIPTGREADQLAIYKAIQLVSCLRTVTTEDYRSKSQQSKGFSKTIS